RAFNAVARDDAVLADFSDSIRDELDVCAIKSRIVIVGNEDTFAAQLILGSERLAELGILDPTGHVPESDGLGVFADGFVAEKSENAKLLAPENILPKSQTGYRYAAKALLPFFGDGEVDPRNDPGRRALKKIELANAGRDLRDELDGAGAGPDDSDVFAFQIHAIVPR